jgi:RNA polymerase sigma-70 factor (ECF subfamily)
VAALQHLPPRQRAVLVLREVLAWSAAEVAAELDMSVAAVNSALQRARQTLGKVALEEGSVAEPDDPEVRALLDRYVDAFWRKDIRTIVSMLAHDAVWEMPPWVGWYTGAENIGRLIDTQCPGGVHEMPMLATSANGQPAFGLYMRQPDGTYTPFHLQVLTLGRDAEGEVRVEHVCAFFESSLFEDFGLPASLPADFGG